jgi:hypothetical protein
MVGVQRDHGDARGQTAQTAAATLGRFPASQLRHRARAAATFATTDGAVRPCEGRPTAVQDLDSADGATQSLIHQYCPRQPAVTLSALGVIG